MVKQMKLVFWLLMNILFLDIHSFGSIAEDDFSSTSTGANKILSQALQKKSYLIDEFYQTAFYPLIKEKMDSFQSKRTFRSDVVAPFFTVMKVKNDSKEHWERYLTSNSVGFLKRVFKVRSDKSVTVSQAGTSVAYFDRPNGYFIDNLPLHLGPGETAIFILQHDYGMKKTMKLKKQPDVVKADKLFLLITSFYFGAIFAIFFYNLWLYFILREKRYLVYLGILLTQHIVLGSFMLGVLGWFVGQWSTLINNSCTIVMFFLYVLCLKEMVSVDRLFPKSYKALYLFATLYGIAFSYLLLCIYGILPFDYQPLYAKTYLFSTIGFASTFIYITFWGSLVKKDLNCRLFALAWSPFLFLMVASLMFQVFDSHILGMNYAAPIGSLFEGIFLSFVLAYQTKKLKDDLYTSEKAMTRRLENVLEASNALNVKSTMKELMNTINEFLIIEIPQLQHYKVLFYGIEEECPTENIKLKIEIHGEASCFGFLVVKGIETLNLSKDQILYIENLLNIFGKTLDGIKFIKSENERSRIVGELEAARLMQQSLLSMNREPYHLDYSFYYFPAEQTGGDWLGKFYDPYANVVYLCCGDVTGHGLQSAFVTAVTAGALEGYFDAKLKKGEKTLDIEKICSGALNAADSAISNTAAKLNKSMTMQIAAIELGTGNVHLANAAHNPLIHITKTKVRFIGVPGSPLGKSLNTYGFRKFKLEDGDKILMYTDGLVENTNKQGEYINQHQLRKFLLKLSGDSQKILHDTLNFANQVWDGNPGEDDYAIISLVWKKNEPLYGK